MASGISGSDVALIVAAGMGTVPATVAAIIGARTHNQVRVPNGDTLGDIAEYLHRRNHDLMNNQAKILGVVWLIAQKLGIELPDRPRLAEPGDIETAIEDLRHRSGFNR